MVLSLERSFSGSASSSILLLTTYCSDGRLRNRVMASLLRLCWLLKMLNDANDITFFLVDRWAFSSSERDTRVMLYVNARSL